MKNSTKENKSLIDRIFEIKILQPFNKILNTTKARIEKSIRFELMVVVGICFLLSFVFYSFTNDLLKREYTEPKITYDYDSIEREAGNIAREIGEDEELKLTDSERINEILNNVSSGDKSYITDLDGKVLYKTSNVVEENIDIYSALKSAMTNIDYENAGNIKEKNYIMPLKIGGERIYLIYNI